MDDTQAKSNKVKLALIFLVPATIVLLILNSTGSIENLFYNIFYPKARPYALFPEHLGFFLVILIIVNTITSLIVGISIKDKPSERIVYGLITFGCSLALALVLSIGWLFLSAFLLQR